MSAADFGRIERKKAKRLSEIKGSSWKTRALRAERKLRRIYVRTRGLRAALTACRELADATDYGSIDDRELIEKHGGDSSTNVWLEGEVKRITVAALRGDS